MVTKLFNLKYMIMESITTKIKPYYNKELSDKDLLQNRKQIVEAVNMLRKLDIITFAKVEETISKVIDTGWSNQDMYMTVHNLCEENILIHIGNIDGINSNNPEFNLFKLNENL